MSLHFRLPTPATVTAACRQLIPPSVPAPSRSKDHLFAILAAVLASALAIPLEMLVTSTNLVLIYVLSVMGVGLKYGWRPALTTSALAFLSFNFFLTEPRYTFHVTQQDELTTLVFFLIIALACGSAASRIRQQFILLHDANRRSEALRQLGQALSVADNADAIWQAMQRLLTETLQRDACVITTDSSDSFPAGTLSPAEQTAIEQAQNLKHLYHSEHNDVFPLLHEQQCIACLLIRHAPGQALSSGDQALIQAMARQASDTWQRTRLAHELENARLKTEIEQLRSALLSSVSHDLRSPLAAMMGAAESLQLLDRQLAAQDRHELTETILQESRRLDSYIQNLLDMTRLGYGTLSIERDWVSVADIIGSALGRLKRYHPGTLTETQFLHTAPVLYVHAALIEQALFNILENAARFTPAEDTIRLTVASEAAQCIIRIEDNGPGIPEHAREQIFDMFFVVADGDSKKQQTGMGLAICRGMINAHGGSVQAMPGSNGQGTCFVIRLPIEPPPARQYITVNT